MPQISDPIRIRRILERDRVWSVYALGDLSPGLFPQCRWYADPHGEALLLLYQAFGTPVLFALGDPETVAPLLDEVDLARAYLSVRPEILPLVQARGEIQNQAAMRRMHLDPSALPQLGAMAGLKRLEIEDTLALGRLYDDGRESGEVPDFFRLSMVRDGVFFGVYEHNELVAAAGTHLVAPQEGVGAVGNVYTRRDRRGRGLARVTTGAVAAELLRLEIRTVALNVDQRNDAALRVYEHLGFRRHCLFYEGLAVFSLPTEARAS